MWILQGLLVCCAIMGMSRLASAETLEEKIKDYKKQMSEDLRIWKIDNNVQTKELGVLKKETLLKLESKRDEQLKIIESKFTDKIETLGKSVREKSNQFQLKSDIAMVKSIQFKREKFAETKKVWTEFYEASYQLEQEFESKLKAFRTESLAQKMEILNENKPSFFPDFSKNRKFKTSKLQSKWNGYKKQFCTIQRFYNKQQFTLDIEHTKFEIIAPISSKVEYLKNQLDLAAQEVQMLDESENALKVMIEQMGKTPKELKRIHVQMLKAKKDLAHKQQEYLKEQMSLTVLENGLKTAQAKRKAELGCRMEMKITGVKTPNNINEHQRIGELY